jgi:uncharacterized protein with HEPN domain
MSDEIWLRDILDAAILAEDFAAGLDEQRFWQSALHQAAIVRQLEIIGEAARRVSPTRRDQLSDIPWTAIVGMRHRIVHDYRNVDLDQVWQTVQQDIPPLIAALEPIVGQED